MKKIIKNKKITSEIINSVSDIYNGDKINAEFNDCEIDCKDIKTALNEFDFYRCIFSNCTFIDNRQTKLVFTYCQFKGCKFTFEYYSDLIFNYCKFIIDDNRKSNILMDGCQIDLLVLEKCNLNGIECNNGRKNNGYKLHFLSYSPSQDRIEKYGKINEEPFITRLCPPQCPQKGSFIGWKQIRLHTNGACWRFALCKLEIPEDALRSSGLGNHCRCNKAKVLDIIGLTPQKRDSFNSNSSWERNKITNKHYKKGYSIGCVDFEYEVGKVVEIEDEFNFNRFNDRGGIHFFMDYQEARDY